jgi:hypothetical protein
VTVRNKPIFVLGNLIKRSVFSVSLEKRQLLMYTYNINLLGENINTVRRNAEFLLVTSKEASLEVSEEKT